MQGTISGVYKGGATCHAPFIAENVTILLPEHQNVSVNKKVSASVGQNPDPLPLP